MDKIDEMQSLNHMYGVINDMIFCEYSPSKEQRNQCLYNKKEKYDQTERI